MYLNKLSYSNRRFNIKYDREAKEKKMFGMLESEAKNSKKKEK